MKYDFRGVGCWFKGGVGGYQAHRVPADVSMATHP